MPRPVTQKKARTTKKFASERKTLRREFFGSSYANKLGIAHHYGVAPRTIDNWIREKKIPHLKVGRLVRFDVARCDMALKRFEIKEVA